MDARPPPPDLLGTSPAMVDVRRILSRAAEVEVPVVLQGETGTGKSHAARWIHTRGRRSDGPFVAVNCSGVPEGLFESEFFGHAKGAFTGALAERRGLFESASGGTLFLDEVAELPLQQQAKLLVAIESGTIRRVGESRDRSVDARVIAATSTPLEEAVERGDFRPDLFHRLALLRCTLPALRERGEDFGPLCRHLLEEVGHRHLGTPARLTVRAGVLIRQHPWPGNIRELAHVIEAAVILTGARRLDESHIRAVLGGGGGAARESEPSGSGAPAETPEPARTDGTSGPRSTRYSFYGTDEEEEEMIRSALRRFRGNRTRAARALGMSRNTLRGRIEKYKI